MPQTALPLTVPDLACLDDLDAFGGETASDLQSLAQDVYHLLLERLGSNLDDLTRGIGVEGLLNGSADALAATPAIIDSQLRKDTRILSSRTRLTFQDEAYTLAISILPVATLVPLPLSFSYSASTGLVPVKP